MSPSEMPIVPLSEMVHGQEADLFALLTAKDELTTRDGKPYWRVTFRDAQREVGFPIWNDAPLAPACRDEWVVGAFYKIRATYQDTNYGPQLEIRKIREVSDADRADGFDPSMCLASSRFEPEGMFEELIQLAQERIESQPLRQLVVSLLTANRQSFQTWPAARRHHHAFAGGLLEHTLCVAKNAAFLADRYAEHYPELRPPLDKGLVVAGAILHDVGKLRELRSDPTGASYTPQGELIGHMPLGRDMIREQATQVDLDAETLLRLEHLILSHQRLPEWGSPKPPMTPEALLVHYADDIDAKFRIMVDILQNDTTEGPLTSQKNLLRQKVYRGSDG